MEKKGIGSVVGVILITLLAIVAAAVFLGFYLKSVSNASSNDSSSCLGLDLKISSCVILPTQLLSQYNIFDPNPAITFNVERLPGRGNINGIRFIVTDSSGNDHVEAPVDLTVGTTIFSTNYSGFIEYGSVNAIVRNVGYLSTGNEMVRVSAVVGTDTLCSTTQPAVKCLVAPIP